MTPYRIDGGQETIAILIRNNAEAVARGDRYRRMALALGAGLFSIWFFTCSFTRPAYGPVRPSGSPSFTELRIMGEHAAREHVNRLGISVLGASCNVTESNGDVYTQCVVNSNGPGGNAELRLACETDGRGCRGSL